MSSRHSDASRTVRLSPAGRRVPVAADETGGDVTAGRHLATAAARRVAAAAAQVAPLVRVVGEAEHLGERDVLEALHRRPAVQPHGALDVHAEAARQLETQRRRAPGAGLTNRRTQS